MLSFVVLLSLITVSPPAVTAQSQPFTLLSQAGRGTILDVMWRPNGDTILADTATGAWIYSADLHDIGHIDGLQLATYSPRGRYISGVASDNIICLYDADTLRPILSVTTTRAQVRSLIWSPKGDLLAELDTSGDLRVWNVVSRSLIFTSRDNNFSSIAWSKAGTYLAASSENLWVWSSAAFEQIFPNENNSPNIYDGPLNWHGDRFLSMLVTGGDWSRLDQWDMDRRESWDADYVQPVGTEADCYEGCSPDYQSVIYAQEYAEIPITLLTNHPRAAVPEIKLGDSVKIVVAWNADSLHAAVGAMLGDSTTAGSGVITLVDIVAGHSTRQIKAHRGDIRFLRWHDDQQRLISVGDDGFLRIWQANDGQLLGETHAHGALAWDAAWSSDHRYLAVADKDNNMRLLDADNLALTRPLGNTLHNQIGSMQWQPYGKLLAVHYLRAWRSNKGERESIGNGSIEIWDTSPPVPTRVALIATADEFADAEWNPDGTQLAIVGRHGFFAFWDATLR
jgi:WD40 repeat protein